MEKFDLTSHITKAEQSLVAARLLWENNLFDFSVSRAYYAMFYMAESLLITRNLSYSKHSAVISAFGREFVKTNELSNDLREWLASAFDLRQLGDYGAPGTIPKEDAFELIEKTAKFIQVCKEYLERHGFLS